MQDGIRRMRGNSDILNVIVIWVSALIFRLTWGTIKAAGVRLPARLWALGLRFALVGLPQARLYLAFAAMTYKEEKRS